ncbi:MAG: hypothetical protein Q7J16_05490 [Candidatus Cloacimonadales bacterium]|nr:hypothetical protein [Candidatus Cloacimonadales bacterium]
MKKIYLICVIFLFFLTLHSQPNYTLTNHSFNAAGGHQSNGSYSAHTAFAEKVQGEIGNTGYKGYLGFLFPQLDVRFPLITSIDDVPNDQGHQVQIVWNKCGYDDIYAFDTYYSIWRLDDDFDGKPAGKNITSIHSTTTGSLQISNISTNIENTYTEPWIIVQKYREEPGKTYFWQRDREVWTFIAEVPALQSAEYSYIAPTLADSNAVSVNDATFKIVYHDIHEYYESVNHSGYSVDDLPPDAVDYVDAGVSSTSRSNTLTLAWNAVSTGSFQGNSYPELNGIWYEVYYSVDPELVCNEATFLAVTQQLTYEADITGCAKMFYKIMVSDQPNAADLDSTNRQISESEPMK